MRTEILAGEDVADQIARGGADQDGIRAGEGLQAGRKVGRLANDGLLARRTLADRLADDDDPAGDADAHGEACAVAVSDLGAERRHRVEDRQTGANRALGIPFLRIRVTEIDEHAVAHELGDVAVVAPDGVADRLLIAADHVAHVFGIELRRKPRRIREIAEHHRQMAALGPTGRSRSAIPGLDLSTSRKGGSFGGGAASTSVRAERPDETLAVEVRRQALDADQFVAKLFDGVVVKTKAELDPAVGNAALGGEAPENFLQYLGEIHDAARLLPAARGRLALIVT